MPPLRHNNSVTTDPEHFKTAEAQGKQLKTVFMKMADITKEEINKSLKEMYEYTHIKKTHTSPCACIMDYCFCEIPVCENKWVLFLYLPLGSFTSILSSFNGLIFVLSYHI